MKHEIDHMYNIYEEIKEFTVPPITMIDNIITILRNNYERFIKRTMNTNSQNLFDNLAGSGLP